MNFTEQDLIENMDKDMAANLEVTKECVNKVHGFLKPYMDSNQEIHDQVKEIFDIERIFMAEVKAVSEEVTQDIQTLEDAVGHLRTGHSLCVESGMRAVKKMLDVIQKHKIDFPESRKLQWLIKSLFDDETLNLGNC